MRLDKGVSVPVSVGRGRAPVWPLGKMAIGDSFAIPAGSVDAVRVAASAYARRHGWRFTVRAQPDGSARCWRVEPATGATPARVNAGRRVVRAVGAKPVRTARDVRVFVDQHGDEFVPLDDMLNATLKTGDTRFALERLESIAEIHPAGAQRAIYAAQLGQIRGAMIGDSAESIADALAPLLPPFELPEVSDDPV